MPSQIDEANLGGKVACRQARGGGRGQHLTGIRQRPDPHDATERCAGIAAVAREGFTRVRRTVDLHSTIGKAALQVDAGEHGIASTMKHRKSRVAYERITDAPAPMAFDGSVHLEQMFGQQAESCIW